MDQKLSRVERVLLAGELLSPKTRRRLAAIYASLMNVCCVIEVTHDVVAVELCIATKAGMPEAPILTVDWLDG